MEATNVQKILLNNCKSVQPKMFLLPLRNGTKLLRGFFINKEAAGNCSLSKKTTSNQRKCRKFFTFRGYNFPTPKNMQFDENTEVLKEKQSVTDVQT